jgi:SAM-dependent methyltransferase
MKIKKFYKQQDFQSFWANDPDIHEYAEFELALMSRHVDEENFLLDGYCKVCDSPTTFLVDRLCGIRETPQGWIPNWRERLVCSRCQLNNRQRATLFMIKEAVTKRATIGQLSLYAMEHVSPLFNWLDKNLNNVTCICSKYLGKKVGGGNNVNGVCYENLNFIDQHFDFIISNNVLEHVNLPERVVAEMYRVLKPHGEIFVTEPIDIYATHTTCRAKRINGELKYLLPPMYHSSPLSEEGILVFNNFGWDFLEQLKAVGFQDVSLCYYWSYLYGYMGEQYYIRACKSD